MEDCATGFFCSSMTIDTTCDTTGYLLTSRISWFSIFMSSWYQLEYHVENKQSCVYVSWFCTGVWSQGPRGNWVVPGSSAAPHVRGARRPVQAEITIDMDEDATRLLSDMDDKGLFHAFGSWQRFHEVSGASAHIHICLEIKYLQHWLVPMHVKVWGGAPFYSLFSIT